ncbi:PAS domain S-box protein [Halorubrum yunnanense]|uniref:PAS domain S-box protein n=1 Tax=Halorubrum yunnanense TaxID=1526162 RepID=A0ABD5YHP4_9EURY|nr:PAS domain S-box protein [Halorubrum yunnanense]
MGSTEPAHGSHDRLLTLSADLNRAETVESAVSAAIELAEATFDGPTVRVCEWDGDADSAVVGSSDPDPGGATSALRGVPDPVLGRLRGRDGPLRTDEPPEATVVTDSEDPLRAEGFVPVGRDRVLRIGVMDPDGFDEAAVSAAEAIAANLETALARIERRRPDGGRGDGSTEAGGSVEADATALRRLNELTVGAGEFDEAIERLLSLGCDYLGLETGILSHVDGDDYEIEAVVDATETHEAGGVYDIGETMCEATLAGDAAEPLAFADVSDTDYRDHPAAEDVRAYVAAPVVVDGETYGTVNFSMGTPRAEPFRPEEVTFVNLVTRWIGTEIERRHRFEELERYETVLEAVGDPVYALDADGRFTYVNEAARREFGYGTETIGKRPTIGMDEADVAQVREQIERLMATGERSATAEFELETADGGRKIVENRLALIGDGEFRGSAGVLRDVTARKKRRRQLESFRRAVEEAKDGIAILDGDEYSFVDQSHVDMYGFESREKLLGSTWRDLYADEEVERLEREAFPALESEGYWRGMVTGTRPDGSTFPAELSLTIVEDGRLVCAVRDETERRARERELELKERAMDEATVGIQISDPAQADNPLVYVNDGFERLTGYTREEALGRNPRFLWGADTDPEQVERLREAIRSEAPVSLENKNYRKDGTPYWSRLSITPVTDESGTVQNYIGIQQDVTERKERERRQEATVAVFERIYEVTTDPNLTFREKVEALLAAGNEYLDLPHGYLTRIETDDGGASGTQRVVYAQGDHERLRAGESSPLSRSYCRRTVGGDEVVAIQSAVEAGWEDDPAYEALGLEAYISGAVGAAGETYGTLCFASTEPRATGFTETEKTFVSLLRRWVGYEIDRRDAQDELRRQRERLEMTLSGTNTGIAEWDLKTDEVTWSETLVDLFDTEGNLEEAVHPDDWDRVRESRTRMVETGDPWVGAFRLVGDDGEARWARIRAVPTYDDDGTADRVLATLTDVTDQKEEERERRRNERRFQSLFEDPGMLVAMLDVDGTLLQANENALAYIEETADEVIGEPFWEASWWSHSAELQDDVEEWIRRAADGEYVEYESSIPGPDGDTWHVTGVVRPVSGDSGSVESLVVSARDVTKRHRQQRELFEERERFRLLTESVDDYAFLIIGEEGDIQTWNESAEQMFGYDAEAAIGMSTDRLHPESDRKSGVADRLIKQARITGESAHEGRRVRADGSTFYADVRYAPLESEDGTFRGYAKIVRDMTERRRQERRTERFVEESDDVVTVLDTDGTVTYASGSTERVLGYDVDDLRGEILFDYLHPDGRERAMRAFFDCVDGSNGTLSESRLKCPDGEWINVEGHFRNMLDNDAIDGILVYLRDVTESKERARRFESIFNQTFQFTGLLEPDGTVIEVNDATLAFGGAERDAVVGEPLSAAPWWQHSKEASHEVRDAVDRAAGGEFVRYETEANGADGLSTVDFSVKPVTDDDGDVSLLVAEGRDVTDKRRQRQHTEVMQRVMRHNMRNDLTKVRGWAEMMAEESDPEKRGEQFETIERVIDKWASMTEKIKAIRRVTQSQQGKQATTACEPLIEAAADEVREEYPDATVATTALREEPVAVPEALHDAVRELVENGVKASENATVAVDVDGTEAGWVEVCVSDDGPGMPDMEVGVLETGEESPLEHGEGLGLWLVRTVVTQAGGEVAVESSDDGTEVCLRLPTARDGDAE